MELGLPAKEGGPGDTKGLLGGLVTVLLPESEGGRSLLGNILDHIPEAYHSFPGTDPALSPTKLVELAH